MDEKPVEETLKGLVSLISLLRGKSKEDSEELAYIMHDVIGEYFQALEDSEDKSGALSLRPASLLPSTKQAIKDALRQMFLVCTDKELKSILATGYASLASFIPDEEFEETVKSSIESADFKTTNQVRIGTEMKVLIKELTDWCDKTQSTVEQLVKAGQEEPS